MSKTKLENFNKLEVKIDYKDIIDKYAEETVKDLKNVQIKGNRTKNNYTSGWEVKVNSSQNKTKGNNQISYGVSVWNATNYYLTHLLEKGHLIVNKKGGVGWASANPHIETIYQKIKQPFIRAMENAKTEVDIK